MGDSLLRLVLVLLMMVFVNMATARQMNFLGKSLCFKENNSLLSFAPKADAEKKLKSICSSGIYVLTF